MKVIIFQGSPRKNSDTATLVKPCPPFYRGEEISDDVIDSPFFVGYNFKASLVAVQQAIIVWLLRESAHIA